MLASGLFIDPCRNVRGQLQRIIDSTLKGIQLPADQLFF